MLPYPGVVETMGGIPTRTRVVRTDEVPAFVSDTYDAAHPFRMPGRAELDDGTVYGWAMHQVGDTEDGLSIILRVWYPAAAPDVYVDEHAQHFVVEFRNIMRMAWDDLAAQR